MYQGCRNWPENNLADRAGIEADNRWDDEQQDRFNQQEFEKLFEERQKINDHIAGISSLPTGYLDPNDIEYHPSYYMEPFRRNPIKITRRRNGPSRSTEGIFGSSTPERTIKQEEHTPEIPEASTSRVPPKHSICHSTFQPSRDQNRSQGSPHLEPAVIPDAQPAVNQHRDKRRTSGTKLIESNVIPNTSSTVRKRRSRHIKSILSQRAIEYLDTLDDASFRHFAKEIQKLVEEKASARGVVLSPPIQTAIQVQRMAYVRIPTPPPPHQFGSTIPFREIP